MTFGEALEALKEGERAARRGWNGKNMWIYLNEGSAPIATPVNASGLINGVPADLFGDGDKGTGIRMPSINLRAADGSVVTGWLASQTDMLAEDWTICP